jgi:hypothetical protein
MVQFEGVNVAVTSIELNNSRGELDVLHENRFVVEVAAEYVPNGHMEQLLLPLVENHPSLHGVQPINPLARPSNPPTILHTQSVENIDPMGLLGT